MFVSHAKVRISGLGGRPGKKRKPHRRRLGLRELASMPCLFPAALTVTLGLIAVASGACMALFGYLPTANLGRNNTTTATSTTASSALIYDHDVSAAAIKTTVTSTSSYGQIYVATERGNPRYNSSTSNSKDTAVKVQSNEKSKNQPTSSTPVIMFSVSATTQASVASTSSGYHLSQNPHHKQQPQPTHHPNQHHSYSISESSSDNDIDVDTNNTETSKNRLSSARLLALRACSYAGPVVMAIGMFAMIMACVFYCEILDKYAILVPDKGQASSMQKEELYQVILGEMKKSYAQTLYTAYTKAAEQSLLVQDTTSGSGADSSGGVASADGEFQQQQHQQQQQQQQQHHRPDPPLQLPYNPLEPLSLEQQIDIECEGYTPSPPIPNKRYSVIQARIQRLRSEDNWLKTSSLPNIRRSQSIKRAGRVSGKMGDSRTLSYDYTMDEARLRRKSMMLRSIVQWNSGSSGDLLVQQAQAAKALHNRRFSSAKTLQNQPDDSLDELLCEPNAGSFPLTRIIQRRGTFACGDMRTRRMKFLLLLQASESNEVFQQQQHQQQQQQRRHSIFPQRKHSQHFDSRISMESRSTFSGIRRNSFIPYNTCDKFIATEEKRSARDSRRASVNPFAPRLAQQYAPPERAAVRRHSFFPIRREDKIYESDPYAQRRHSFNPIGVNNTLKAELGGAGERRGSYIPDSRRGSYIPESRRGSLNPDSRRGSLLPDSRRGSFVPSQSLSQARSSRFLQVPGFEQEFPMERRPSGDSSDGDSAPSTRLSSYSRHLDMPGHQSLGPNMQDFRAALERRQSFNPIVRVSDEDGEPPKRPESDVPTIVVNADVSGRFLMVPPEDVGYGGGLTVAMAGGDVNRSDNRRSSLNATSRPPLGSLGPPVTVERHNPQRGHMRLDPQQHMPSGMKAFSSAFPASSPTVSHHEDSASLKPSPSSSPGSAGSNTSAVRPSSFNQEMVLFQPLPRSDSRGASPGSNISFCGSERIGSERSPKASRTVSMSSDNSEATCMRADVAPLRQSEMMETPPRGAMASGGSLAACGYFRPVTPSGQPSSSHCFSYEDEQNTPVDATPCNQPYALMRRCRSFRENRGGRSSHRDGRIDSEGSESSDPTSLSPSTVVDANASIHRSRSAGSLPGWVAGYVRANPNRWEDDDLRPFQAGGGCGRQTFSPQSPPRMSSYASWRAAKPPSPLVFEHRSSSRQDAESNSS